MKISQAKQLQEPHWNHPCPKSLGSRAGHFLEPGIELWRIPTFKLNREPRACLEIAVHAGAMTLSKADMDPIGSWRMFGGGVWEGGIQLKHDLSVGQHYAQSLWHQA